MPSDLGKIRKKKHIAIECEANSEGDRRRAAWTSLIG